MFYTYLWLREDGTPYYAGKGSGKRAYQNKDHYVYRPESNSCIVVQHWASEEEAFRMEKWWIAFWGRKDIGTGILRNMTDGGDGPSGWVPSEETKAKIRESLKGQAISEETKKKLKMARAHRVYTNEMRRNMSIGIKAAKAKLWKHGTRNGYEKHDCRCELCKTNHDLYRKNQKSTRRQRREKRNIMAVSGTVGGTTRDGKPVTVGDAISISGFVTAVAGTGSQASLTVQCAGVAANPLTPNVPYNVTVLAADTTATQSL